MPNFEDLVQKIRRHRGVENARPCPVPGFDPRNGNESARYLLLLEAPGPGALQGPNIVSYDNDDPTARNLGRLLKETGVPRSDIALWNIVPWYLGDEGRIRAANAEDLREGEPFLHELLQAIPGLKAILLLGGKARAAHLPLSKATTARILTCHHTSLRGLNGNQALEDNKAVFRMLIKDHLACAPYHLARS